MPQIPLNIPDGTGQEVLDAINAAITALQNDRGGYLSKSVAGGSNITLTTTEVDNALIAFTGALTANIQVIVPATSFQWIFYNGTTGSYSLTVKTASGTGVTIPQGKVVVLWCNGTNVLGLDYVSKNGDTLSGALTLSNGQVADYLSPAGAIQFFGNSSAPSGWLKANGAAVSRITYASLFSAIGTTFGVGDGSTTFNLPDLRGYFPRGWVDNGSVDSGRAFGSTQTDQFQGHYHSVSANPYMTFYPSGGGMSSGGGAAFQTPTVLGPSTDGTNGTPRVGSETRPSNVALLACIKY